MRYAARDQPVEAPSPLDAQIVGRLGVSRDALAVLCQRWKIEELSLFGSVLRNDFRPESDIDVLVSFTDDAAHSLFDLMDLQEELEAFFGRPVDLAEKRALRNPFRRREILRTSRILYAA